MRLLCAAVAAALLTSAAPVAALSQAADATSATPVFHPRWGALAELAGREWTGNRQRHRFVWSDDGRTLTWEVTASEGSSWSAYYIFTESAAGIVAQLAGGRSRGPVSVDAEGSAVARVGDLGATTRFARDGDGFRVVFRPIPVTWRLELRPDGWTGETLQQASAPAEPTARRAPIVIAQATPAAAAERREPNRGRQAAPPAPAPPATTQPGGSRPGPIVIASAPPPPALVRSAPRSPTRTETPRPGSTNSREAQMLAQVETRRIAAAREAEAERLRQAQIAEQARQAEEARRAREAANSAAWSEGFGFLAALAGGVAAGMQTGGDMASISGGMAVGASLVAPNSEVAAATSQNFQAEYQRFEEQRAHEAAVIAAMNDPNNPLTQEARRRDEARETRAQAETARIETESRERREEADREALMQERAAAARQDEADGQARQEQAEADEQRREQQARRAAEQREREAQQAREEQERRDAEARQRREQAEREAEARRQEQERQRAAAEAERNRVIDFKEAVVLCSLTGPQAQFNNWRCEGPLQMTYVNFERPNVAFHFDQMSCASYRELPRAGPYRAFGCGYGLHPTNPGASRNVPEMLGVFVDGRITFRCPRNISGVCRDR